MARTSSYWAALRPGIDDRKASRMAQAPSTASSRPGRRHTELLLIQPLRNNVSPSGGHKEEERSEVSITCTIVLLESVRVSVFIETGGLRDQMRSE